MVSSMSLVTPRWLLTQVQDKCVTERSASGRRCLPLFTPKKSLLVLGVSAGQRWSLSTRGRRCNSNATWSSVRVSG